MNNEKLLAAVLALPDADLLTASKLTDPIGAGAYYRADTVARLLATERERWDMLLSAPRRIAEQNIKRADDCGMLSRALVDALKVLRA